MEGLPKSNAPKHILRPISADPDAMVHRIPLAMSQKQKTEIEKESLELGISEQAFIRLCVRIYFRAGGLSPELLNKFLVLK